MTDIIVGIDDTDVDGSPGTGRLARELAGVLRTGGADVAGVTRHQLWRDASVPYTSRNSAAGLVVRGLDSVASVADTVETFLRQHHVEGADPALAAGHPAAATPALVGLGRRAKYEFVEMDEADDLSQTDGVILRSVAGRRHGIVGALAAFALRADGNDGRFIELAGIRSDWTAPTVADLLAQTGIARVVDEQDRAIPDQETIRVDGWLRPSLRYGEPTLVVTRSDSAEGWTNVERPGHAHRHRH